MKFRADMSVDLNKIEIAVEDKPVVWIEFHGADNSVLIGFQSADLNRFMDRVILAAKVAEANR